MDREDRVAQRALEGKVDAIHGMVDTVIRHIAEIKVIGAKVNALDDTINKNGLTKDLKEVQEYILSKKKRETAIKRFAVKHGWKILLIGGLLAAKVLYIEDILGAIKLW